MTLKLMAYVCYLSSLDQGEPQAGSGCSISDDREGYIKSKKVYIIKISMRACMVDIIITKLPTISSALKVSRF